jgi:hypothetical protein
VPLTSKGISGALVLLALGACVPLLGMIYAALAFSGRPSSVTDYIAFGISASFWIPVAASWKFPISGLITFALLFFIALIMCIDSHTSLGQCLYSLVFQLISGAFLLLNLLFIYVIRRKPA